MLYGKKSRFYTPIQDDWPLKKASETLCNLWFYKQLKFNSRHFFAGIGHTGLFLNNSLFQSQNYTKIIYVPWTSFRGKWNLSTLFQSHVWGFLSSCRIFCGQIFIKSPACCLKVSSSRFLQLVVSHPAFSKDEDLQKFLKEENVSF